MYAIMLVQMFYIFTGNTVHEITGIAFFVCLTVHIIIKRKHIKAMLTGKLKNAGKAQKFSAFVTCLLFVGIILLMLTSMGVSRLLFPWFRLLQSPDLHRYLAATVFTLAAVHGGMHFYIRTGKKKSSPAHHAHRSRLPCTFPLRTALYQQAFPHRQGRSRKSRAGRKGAVERQKAACCLLHPPWQYRF